MSYRICRHITSSTFIVNGQLCKVFLEPMAEHKPGYWWWNVGFAIGKSKRQLNDWYWKRKNKRRRSLDRQIVGTSGMKAIARGFKEVLKLRWTVEPGDVIVLDCTSGDPERQFHAWSRWHKHHPEWVIDYQERKFFWHRPPYPEDPLRQKFLIQPVIPEDPMANTAEQRYYDCFRVFPKVPCTDLSMEQTIDLLNLVL